MLNVCVLVAQSCPTLCNPMDCSPPGSSVREILLARILEQVAISCSSKISQYEIISSRAIIKDCHLNTI